ncbi:MAG: nucleotide exchange factor GrpE [Thermoplasmata archaeon]|nr:nucleotide exchange factor GrpE [Thermoplasmata archaeon]
MKTNNSPDLYTEKPGLKAMEIEEERGKKAARSRGPSKGKKKGEGKKREHAGIFPMGKEIEKEIEELEDGKFRNLKDYSNTERLLIFQNELLNQIKMVNDYREALQRVAADFDNFRKRSEKDRESIIKFANEGLISRLLDVLDNLERALKNVEDREEDPFVQGIQMIYDQSLKIMEEEGLEAIDKTGVAFDPYKHEAMMQVVNDELEENTVIDILQKGYYLKNKVIRPAKVQISKKEA